ncbi:hypothetical protein J6590_047948 [Homalodisca vitripennis]|nr:hypothetical protein J6590_047948 [Homalodisca vitripennis]
MFQSFPAIPPPLRQRTQICLSVSAKHEPVNHYTITCLNSLSQNGCPSQGLSGVQLRVSSLA